MKKDIIGPLTTERDGKHKKIIPKCKNSLYHVTIWYSYNSSRVDIVKIRVTLFSRHRTNARDCILGFTRISSNDIKNTFIPSTSSYMKN